jgi:hypothetical protein
MGDKSLGAIPFYSRGPDILDHSYKGKKLGIKIAEFYIKLKNIKLQYSKKAIPVKM